MAVQEKVYFDHSYILESIAKQSQWEAQRVNLITNANKNSTYKLIEHEGVRPSRKIPIGSAQVLLPLVLSPLSV